MTRSTPEHPSRRWTPFRILLAIALSVVAGARAQTPSGSGDGPAPETSTAPGDSTTVADSLVAEPLIEVAPDTRAYMETMMALPAFQEWTREGLAETLVIAKFEDA